MVCELRNLTTCLHPITFVSSCRLQDELEKAELFKVDVDVETLQPLNSLLLHFYSAKLYAQDLERQFGRVRAGSCNLGDPSRVYVRKAQYDWR